MLCICFEQKTRAFCLPTALTKIWLLLLIFGTLPFFSLAQISQSAIPPSWQHAARYHPDYQRFKSAIPNYQVAIFPLQKIKTEDQQSARATRFAAPIVADINLNQEGDWTTLANGDRIWRLRISSENALAIAFLYDDFYLPAGAQLFMYNADRKQLLGAYTEANNQSNGKMLTGFIKGKTAILEYYEPQAVMGQGRFHIFRVEHAYRSEILATINADFVINSKNSSTFGYGESLECEVNMNCEEGANLQRQKRGVTRILMVAEEGTNYCSGTLLNNTTRDQTPYVLSAYHCMQGYTPLYDFWRFDFNYENPGCANSLQEPDYQSVIGCTQRAGNPDSDFVLVEINHLLPTDFNVFYNGWNRAEQMPNRSAMIHHPMGDVKKISVDYQAAEVYPSAIRWSNDVTTPAGFHLRTDFDRGTFEVGSSGGALFDANGLVCGQLHGGNASCTRFRAYFGRLSASWSAGNQEENRLENWLDPLGISTSQLYGMEQNSAVTTSVSGNISTENNLAVSNVKVQLEGASQRSTTTDLNGNFTFSGLAKGQDYTLSLVRDGDDLNGVSTLDVIRIRQHILTTRLFDSPAQFLAADINHSKSVSTLDLIKLQKLVLNIVNELTENHSWRFVPTGFQYTNPVDNPFEYNFAPVSLQNLTEPIQINFLGIKVGDLNLSAVP